MFQNVEQPQMTQTGRNLFGEADTPELSAAKGPALSFEQFGSGTVRAGLDTPWAGARAIHHPGSCFSSRWQQWTDKPRIRRMFNMRLTTPKRNSLINTSLFLGVIQALETREEKI